MLQLLQAGLIHFAERRSAVAYNRCSESESKKCEVAAIIKQFHRPDFEDILSRHRLATDWDY